MKTAPPLPGCALSRAGLTVRSLVPAIVVLGALAVVPARAQQVTFRNVADTLTPVPGQSASGNFTRFDTPSISGGSVAFLAYDNAVGGTGVYTAPLDGTSPSRVADTTTTVPGQSQSYSSLYPSAVVSGGNVVFAGAYASDQISGIYVGTAGALSVVADSATTVPGQGGHFASIATHPAISGSNVAFNGFYGSNGRGVYLGAAGAASPLSRVADSSTTVPGTSVGFSGFGYPAISGGNVAFGASDNNGAGGIYLGGANGAAALSRVADFSTTVPGKSGGFSSFGYPAISGTTVAFSARYNAGNASGIYTSSGGSLNTVVDTTSAVPDRSGTFYAFGDPALSGDNLAFAGSYKNGNTVGLFVRINGVLVDILDTGSTLFGGKLTALSLGTTGFDGANLVFQYSLANGISGVAVANVVSIHPAFFTGEVALSQGVYYLAFPGNGNIFGYYSYLSDPRYVFHQDLGYEYVFNAADGNNGVYFYDFTSSTFFYTSPSFPFPYLYDFNLKAFLYYYPDPTNPQRYNTKGVRYFYNFSTGKIITK